MKIVSLFLIPFFLLAVPFKVASYNVENLFDAVNNGTEYDEFIPGRHNWSKRMAERKLNHTAEVLCDLNADIVGLQEVENAQVFRQLQKRLARVGCPYRYGVITSKRNASVQVALLSRFPIQSHRDLRVSFADGVRDILEADVIAEGYPLKLFVNHWKSRSRKGFESKRIAYAKVLRKRLERLPKGSEYMLLGDFNTDYDAYLTLPKRLNDTNGRIGLNHLLGTVKEGALLSKVQVKNGNGVQHYDLWQELPYRQRWSHRFYGHKSTLDHILLPKTMFDGKKIDYVNNSFAVFKPRYLFTKKGYINHWEIKAGRHTGRGYSDHLPIYALFDTIPFVPSSKDDVQKPVIGTIDMLYKNKKLQQPIILKDAVVVLKRGRYAVIKQSPKGRGIFVFGALRGLEEGKRYDLRVDEAGSYRGLKEITSMVKLREKGRSSLAAYYDSLENLRMNEVVRNIAGVYKNGYLYTGSQSIPIYFKNRKLTPKNGAQLTVYYAHIGYYKRIQLVVYSKKDFRIRK